MSSVLHTVSGGGVSILGDLRLVGSSENGRGAVEIYTQLGPVSICPDSNWNNGVAQKICEVLGYESGVVVK